MSTTPGERSLQSTYSSQDIRFGLLPSIIGMINVFLLMPNDFRYLKHSPILVPILAFKVLVSVAVIVIVLASLRSRTVARYEFLQGISVVLYTILEIVVSLTRPSTALLSFLPSIHIIAFIYFVVPADKRLRIGLSSGLMIWHLIEFGLIRKMRADFLLTLATTYLGLNVVGIVNVTVMARLRLVGQAWKERVEEEGLPGAPTPAQGGASVADRLARLPLSRREREIGALVIEGRQRAEIAERLFISEETVKKHVSNIYQKLGIRSKIEFAALVYDEPVPVVPILRKKAAAPIA